MPEDLMAGRGSDWRICTPQNMASTAGTNMFLLRNESTDGYDLAFRSIRVDMGGAGRIELRAAAGTSALGASGIRATARPADIGRSSHAFPGTCYHGTTTVASGIAASTNWTVDRRRIEAAGAVEFADEKGEPRLAANYALLVRAIPDAKTSVQVSAWAREIRVD